LIAAWTGPERFPPTLLYGRLNMPKRMLMNAFSMNCVSHIQQGLWVRDDTRQLEYNQLDPWVATAPPA